MFDCVKEGPTIKGVLLRIPREREEPATTPMVEQAAEEREERDGSGLWRLCWRREGAGGVG